MTKPKKRTRYKSEHKLQITTENMVKGWKNQDWGERSAENFARFCKWLVEQIEALQPKPKRPK